MTTQSMYQASVPVLVRMLGNLRGMLDKAQAHALENKYEPTVFLQMRLYPDMFPLIRQVQIVCDNAKGCVARLGGQEPPKHEDIESNFDELRARIDKVLAFVKTFTPAHIDGSEGKAIELKFGPTYTLNFTGLDYLNQFVLGNVYFHISMVYAILRGSGVPLGKTDFLGKS